MQNVGLHHCRSKPFQGIKGFGNVGSQSSFCDIVRALKGYDSGTKVALVCILLEVIARFDCPVSQGLLDPVMQFVHNKASLHKQIQKMMMDISRFGNGLGT